MREVDVLGVGMTAFGRQPGLSLAELGRAAVLDAIVDAGVDRTQIEATFAATVLGGSSIGQRIAKLTGLGKIPTTNVENACASGSTALHQAFNAVASGQFDVVLAVGAESLTEDRGPLPVEASDFEGRLGLTMPAVYAMRAKRFLEERGEPPEVLAGVAVKNWRHATLNPRALHARTTTAEEVLASRVVADPLTLLQCCPRADGAAAVIVCSSTVSSRFTTRPVRILASQLSAGAFTPGFRDMVTPEITNRAAREAFELAGLGPETVSLAEVHDAFTVSELLYYEALQLCAPGNAADHLRSGAATLGGRTPVNPSGGLLAKGHPLGATGLAQVHEAVIQLRGDAGARQVDSASVALCHCTGGGISGYDHASASIHILGRAWKAS